LFQFPIIVNPRIIFFVTLSRLHQLAISDEGFVFDPTTGESFTVNLTGLLVLRGLKEGKSIKEIIETIKEEFDSTPEEVERDINDFMVRLRILKIIEG